MAVAAVTCIYVIYMCVFTRQKKKINTSRSSDVRYAFYALQDLAGVETPRANSKPMGSFNFLRRIAISEFCEFTGVL